MSLLFQFIVFYKHYDQEESLQIIYCKKQGYVKLIFLLQINNEKGRNYIFTRMIKFVKYESVVTRLLLLFVIKTQIRKTCFYKII